MSLTFYFAPQSTASTVHWTLEELGIPYEKVQVDLRDPADKAKKLGPVNPNLKVPVLVHDGAEIFESAAIQAYLGETFGVEKGVYPAAGRARGEALKWLVWCNASLVEAVSRWLRNTSDWVPAELRHAPAGKQAREEVDGLFAAVLESALGDRPYILGAEISIVDFHLASTVGWVASCGVDLAAWRKTAAWLARCSDRPVPRRLREG
jgi:glutathione S-transferase